MCYGMNCGYEDYFGECAKPGRLPCPCGDDYDPSPDFDLADRVYDEQLYEKTERAGDE